MARDRSDLRWQHLEEKWQRLLWARETAGYGSAAAFARAIREKEHTYKAYERDPGNSTKATEIDYVRAVAWSSKLDVRWEWLLNNEGLPWRDEAVSGDTAAARLSRLLAGEPPEEQERVLQMVEIWLRKAG